MVTWTWLPAEEPSVLLGEKFYSVFMFPTMRFCFSLLCLVFLICFFFCYARFFCLFLFLLRLVFMFLICFHFFCCARFSCFFFFHSIFGFDFFHLYLRSGGFFDKQILNIKLWVFKPLTFS